MIFLGAQRRGDDLGVVAGQADLEQPAVGVLLEGPAGDELEVVGADRFGLIKRKGLGDGVDRLPGTTYRT